MVRKALSMEPACALPSRSSVSVTLLLAVIGIVRVIIRITLTVGSKTLVNSMISLLFFLVTTG
jgi:hypothetical protein